MVNDVVLSRSLYSDEIWLLFLVLTLKYVAIIRIVIKACSMYNYPILVLLGLS